MKTRQVHLRIGRLVVDAPVGQDRAALLQTLAGQLPGTIAERMTGTARPPLSLQDRIADAVAQRVATQLP